ncbi:6-bladed beta-propeller [Roseivirga echinicomitans]|uniref:6-bladed beta-propeller n=1 Tax=Roseivirga echinicomitans TaxID=296218 RepID=A0A150XWX6_9BACT|nr:6-bladed beta-propeller [Roseivirga echinicomitans]KYG83260.1 hypothetical protein AWN68_00145 [Roseivirga echinicomitans]
MLSSTHKRYTSFYLFIAVAVIFSTGCNNSDQEISIRELEISKSFDVLSDSIFFSLIHDIEFYNNNYYLVDQRTSRVIVTDSSFENTYVLMEKGPGPSDPKSLYNIDIANDTIYSLEFGSGIKTYDLKGNLLDKIDFPPSVLADFKVSDRGILISNPSLDDTPITIVPKEKNGKYIYFGSPEANSLDYDRHILTHGENIIEVFKSNRPIIKYYDNNLKMSDKLDLSTLNFFKYTKRHADANEGLTVVWDAVESNDYIYLLMACRDPSDAMDWSKVLKIKLEDNRMYPESLIQLNKDAYYMTLEVSNDGKNILAYNTKLGSLDVYEL